MYLFVLFENFGSALSAVETHPKSVSYIKDPIPGNIPKWIEGDLISVGPGVFDIGDFTMNHWCDGYSVVCKFSLSRQNVTFTKRHLNSDAYCKAKSVGKPVFTEFGTKAYSDPSRGFFSKMMNNVMPEVTDNASNCIYQMGQSVYVSTESSSKRTLNVETLQSEKKVDLTDILGVNLACSHVFFDSEGVGYALGTSLTSGVKTQIFRIPKGTDYKDAKTLCTLPTKYKTSLSFVHSFGLGQKHIVFIEQPLFMSGMKLISMTLKGKAMYDTMEWKPEEKNRFIVVDKSTGNVSPIVYESELAFFFYHHINTYEENDELIIDVLVNNGPEVIEKLWMKNLREGVFDLNDKPTARRFVLPLIKSVDDLTRLPENVNLVKSSTEVTAVRRGDKIVVRGVNLTEPSYDLPTVNSKYFGINYTYFYATGMYIDGPYRNSVVKVNTATGDVLKWTAGSNEFPGEPLFLPTPGSSSEDDGVLLALVPNTETKDTFLVVLRADTMKELARATVKSHTPCLIHGIFVKKP